MPENQASEIPSRILTAPPGLTLIGADAAGVCADGHCALSPAQPTSVDGVAGVDAGDARASGADAG
ncbi:hypothetical protein [Microbacterium sp.]|uniref:hypothetical protein n=1 Tax=Microbacterium sp. TaxID=51671 RepID=UPI0028AB2DD7|nr:hypothetical protein [Microbacterium sp.]